jgi:Na+/H+ antiporter NhaC
MSQSTPAALEAPAHGRVPRWVVVLAVLLVGAILVPWRGAPVERLAALALADVVAQRGDDEAIDPLAGGVLDSRHVAIDDAARTIGLRLGVLEFTVDGTPADADAVAAARRAFLQGLRATAEAGFVHDGRALDGSAGYSLTVAGERTPEAGGLGLRVRLSGADASGQRRLEVEALLDESLVGGAGNPVAGTDWREPTRFSLLPPVLAIALAIATRRPLFSLACGVVVGAILAAARTGGAGLSAVAQGLIDVPATYLWERLSARNELFIVLFVVFMLAMVGNTVRNGGIAGVMRVLARRAKDARSTQVASYFMGLAIFFDDYANTVLVGSTMRPLTDRFRVAREKLAYIVDSTSAPVAGISIFSTWIAFEVSTFSAQLPAAGLATTEGYAVFVQTLPYRFYCIFTLLLLALIVFTNRDFGPMGKAERRARTTGAVLRPGAVPLVSSASTDQEMAPGVEPAAWRAIVPIGGFIATTLFMIAQRGGAFAVDWSAVQSFQDFVRVVTGILYDGSGNEPLMIGGATGFALAALATASAGIPREIGRAAWTTLRSMGVAFGILYSAWMVADVCGALGTGPFLSAIVSDTIAGGLLPVALLLLSGVVAFATGSSWSTMGILLPMVVGVSYQLGEQSGIGGLALMVLCIGSVLEGSIFGDHCSPISDTTVLSSISSASDHMDHVRTQAPYALTAMGVSIAAGYLPAAYLGWSPLLCLALGAMTLVAIVFVVGRPNEPRAT